MFLLIADLYKTEVYAFGKSFRFARKHQNAIPTDGLWDVDRTDEQNKLELLILNWKKSKRMGNKNRKIKLEEIWKFIKFSAECTKQHNIK